MSCIEVKGLHILSVIPVQNTVCEKPDDYGFFFALDDDPWLMGGDNYPARLPNPVDLCGYCVQDFWCGLSMRPAPILDCMACDMCEPPSSPDSCQIQKQTRRMSRG